MAAADMSAKPKSESLAARKARSGILVQNGDMAAMRKLAPRRQATGISRKASGGR